MFLRNCWYVAAWAHELGDGSRLSRRLLGDPILLYRGASGKVVALSNLCPHRGALLSEGRIEGDDVRCLYHGIKYDSTGRCVQIPGQDLIPPRLRVRNYPVVEANQLIWIWMGDARKADPGLIIDVPYLRDPAWKGIPAYLHYEANYLLIVDNVSDFSHLAFVHTNTLGGSEEYAYVSAPSTIERLPLGYRFERSHLNSDPPPFHKKVIQDKDAKVDRRNVITMSVPGVFLMETLFTHSAGAKEYRNCQLMTPETERTTHFFFSYLNNFEGDDASISRSLLDSLIEGFMEDKAIIERQQRTLDENPQFQALAVQSDAALSHFRRVLNKLIEEENPAALE